MYILIKMPKFCYIIIFICYILEIDKAYTSTKAFITKLKKVSKLKNTFLSKIPYFII